MLNLSDVSVGQKVMIADFGDTDIKCYSARLGLEQGQTIKCIAKLGPVVVQKNHQEIALGKSLSKKILVKALGIND